MTSSLDTLIDLKDRYLESARTMEPRILQAYQLAEERALALEAHAQRFLQAYQLAEERALASAPIFERLLQEHEYAWKHIQETLAAIAHHEKSLKMRRARLEAIIADNSRCGYRKCSGTLVIREQTTAGGVVVGVDLVCDRCSREKWPSPEYGSCEQADEFLEAAMQLRGVPPFPASYNAYQACELYLRELGGYYYFVNDEDEAEFQSPSDKHGLSTLRGKLRRPRLDRLVVEQTGGATFLDLFKQLPNGLWPLLRYGEDESLSYPDRDGKPQPSLNADGRLCVDGVDVFETLVQMGQILKSFVLKEFRRNIWE